VAAAIRLAIAAKAIEAMQQPFFANLEIGLVDLVNVQFAMEVAEFGDDPTLLRCPELDPGFGTGRVVGA
jgi:hypothetical protein